MSMQKIIGLVIAAGGLVALFLSQSTLVFVLGIVLAVVGLGVFLINPKGKK